MRIGYCADATAAACWWLEEIDALMTSSARRRKYTRTLRSINSNLGSGKHLSGLEGRSYCAAFRPIIIYDFSTPENRQALVEVF